MFLVTGVNSITGWIMMGALMVCGVFFVAISCFMKTDPAGADIDSSKLSASMTK